MHQALPYLLKHGPEPALRGCTPLLAATVAVFGAAQSPVLQLEIFLYREATAAPSGFCLEGGGGRLT